MKEEMVEALRYQNHSMSGEEGIPPALWSGLASWNWKRRVIMVWDAQLFKTLIVRLIW